LTTCSTDVLCHFLPRCVHLICGSLGFVVEDIAAKALQSPFLEVPRTLTGVALTSSATASSATATTMSTVASSTSACHLAAKGLLLPMLRPVLVTTIASFFKRLAKMTLLALSLRSKLAWVPLLCAILYTGLFTFNVGSYTHTLRSSQILLLLLSARLNVKSDCLSRCLSHCGNASVG